jgi:hypothetical protein
MKFCYKKTDPEKVITAINKTVPAEDEAQFEAPLPKDFDWQGRRWQRNGDNNEIVLRDTATVDTEQKDTTRAAMLIKLEEDLHAYINLHYNPETQNSMIKIALRVMRDMQKPDVDKRYYKKADDVLDAIELDMDTLDTWIDTVVGTYYYTKKYEIENTPDPSTVTWDFNIHDASKPAVTLRKVYGKLLGS